MRYEELHRRYGNCIASRVRTELNPSEFSHIKVDELPAYLDLRAVTAQKEYRSQVEDPTVKFRGAGAADVLYYRWRGAENLAGIIHIACDAISNSVSSMNPIPGV
jgi:hypothetical protein